MREIAIEVKDLCVNYKIMKRQSIKSLLTKKGRDKTSLFSAVKNVSFSLEKGTIILAEVFPYIQVTNSVKVCKILTQRKACVSS